MSFDQDRWDSERQFFDSEEYSEERLPDSTVERYMNYRKPFLPAEYPFWALGDVRGKRAFEIGCGDGRTSILMALKGAQVVGVDISPRAIEAARKRAALHNVTDRVEFHAMPLELYLEQHAGKFDIVYGLAVLHHLIPVLESVLTHLKALAHDETMWLFQEPVALSHSLRKLRLALPLATCGTPDERPLETAELEILRRYIPNMQMRLFGLLSRVWGRFIGGRYEDYPALQRTLYDLSARIDQAVLAVPAMAGFGSVAVFHSPLLSR